MKTYLTVAQIQKELEQEINQNTFVHAFEPGPTEPELTDEVIEKDRRSALAMAAKNLIERNNRQAELDRIYEEIIRQSTETEEPVIE